MFGSVLVEGVQSFFPGKNVRFWCGVGVRCLVNVLLFVCNDTQFSCVFEEKKFALA